MFRGLGREGTLATKAILLLESTVSPCKYPGDPLNQVQDVEWQENVQGKIQAYSVITSKEKSGHLHLGAFIKSIPSPTRTVQGVLGIASPAKVTLTT